jgi:hypothetical protein
MKRNRILPFSILSSGVLAAWVTCRAGASQAVVYAQGAYSFGVTYFNVCSTTLPFPPFKYNLTEISWSEDAQGSLITDVSRKPAPGDTPRRCLEVESGSEYFFLPLGYGPSKAPFKSIGDPPIPPLTIPGVKGSGDFASVVTKCATNRGGRAITNAIPVFQASWICGSLTNEDIFILEGDHFAEIQNVLEQAYGKSEGSIRSSEEAGGDCCTTNYAPARIGVFLNLTRTWDDTTIVSIIGKPCN